MSGDPQPGDHEPVVRLERWDGDWTEADPYAGLKADVAAYAHLDPLTTVGALSEATGIPEGALARYVLAHWASGGNDALLELGVSGVDHLARIVADAEAAGSDADRLAAYAAIKDVIAWLRADPGAERGGAGHPDGDVSGAGGEGR